MEPYQSMLSFNTRPERAGQFRSAAPGLVEMAAALEPFSIVSVYVSAADTYYQAAMASHGDDSDLATYTSPQLTTVRIPVEHMAANACRWLLNACFGMAHPVIHEFKPILMRRQSVAPCDVGDDERMAIHARGADDVALSR